MLEAMSASTSVGEASERAFGVENRRRYTYYKNLFGLQEQHLALVVRSANSREANTVENTLCLSNKGSKHVRNLVLKKGLLEYICAKCGLGAEWRGESLTLQLDHISGDRRDNRLENLRFLCPNCHTQTDTYASKSPLFRDSVGEKTVCRGVCVRCGGGTKSKSRGHCRPCFLELSKTTGMLLRFNLSEKELMDLLKTHTFKQIGVKFGVTGSAIYRRCKMAGISVREARGGRKHVAK